MLLYADSFKSILDLLTLLVIFAFVLGVTYFTTRYIANFQRERTEAGNIRLLEATRLAQNKYIQLVKIGDKYFALAVCKDTVSVICELDESEIKNLDGVNENLPSFSDILKKFKKENAEKDNTQ